MGGNGRNCTRGQEQPSPFFFVFALLGSTELLLMPNISLGIRGCGSGTGVLAHRAFPALARGRLTLGFHLSSSAPQPSRATHSLISLGIKDPWAFGRWWPRILCLFGFFGAVENSQLCFALLSSHISFLQWRSQLSCSSPDPEGGIPSSVYALSLLVPSQLGKARIPGAWGC